MQLTARTSLLTLALIGACFCSGRAEAQIQIPRSPYLVRGFFSSNLGGNSVLVVWSGSQVETDSVWMGYRVRRTINGITPTPFELVGQHKSKNTVTSACLAIAAPCDLSHFVFYGTGIFFKGFRSNLVNGRYLINYPPGAPVDVCDTCWVFVDQANLAGFTSQYAVTSIDTVHIVNNDFTESPINPSEIVTVQPSTGPADNLERVAVVPNPFRGSAEWDPAAGDNRVHFTHLPASSTVRIFTSNGELVRILVQNPNANAGGTTGDLEWDLKNADGRKVVSGIYIYQVESPQGHSTKGHFVIIR
ncbi:MAG TPA: T9SS type A sorting domain-containing protein [Candidatus Saccharimonadales bacterium]|nr:T9SS type A sorting domain-containing protein [Candidatus Saccharimonadales bacterium]